MMSDRLPTHAAALLNRAAGRLASAKADLGQALAALPGHPPPELVGILQALDASSAAAGLAVQLAADRPTGPAWVPPAPIPAELPGDVLPIELTPPSAEGLYVLLQAMEQLRHRLDGEVWEHDCPPRKKGPARDHCPLCEFDVITTWLEGLEDVPLWGLSRHLARAGRLEALVPQVLDGLQQLISQLPAEVDPAEDATASDRPAASEATRQGPPPSHP